MDVRGFGIFSVVENQLLVLDNGQLVLEWVLSTQLSKPTIGKEKLSLGLSLGPHRVYTECLEVYTESTQKNSGSIQSLHRVIYGLHRVYTGWLIQGLHRAILGLHRVYTE